MCAYSLPQKHVYFSISLNSLLFKKVLFDLSLCCSWLLLSSRQLVASTGRHPASHLESLERGAQVGAKMKWLRETENRVENEYLRQESLSTGALVTAEAKTSATWERKNIRGWFPRIIGEANLGILKYIRICISANLENIEITYDTVTAVRRRCTDWYEIWALRDHEIYYIKIELDLRKFSIGPFSEGKRFWGKSNSWW